MLPLLLMLAISVFEYGVCYDISSTDAHGQIYQLQMVVQYWFPPSTEAEMCDGDPDATMTVTPGECVTENSEVTTLYSTQERPRKSFAVAVWDVGTAFACATGTSCVPVFNFRSAARYFPTVDCDGENVSHSGAPIIDASHADGSPANWAGMNWNMASGYVFENGSLVRPDGIIQYGGSNIVCSRTKGTMLDFKYMLQETTTTTTVKTTAAAQASTATPTSKLVPFLGCFLGLVPALLLIVVTS